jgi:hypothetical protein
MSRSFPYPVVTIGGSDYENTIFMNEVSLGFELENSASLPKISWELNIDNESIQSLLADRKAGFVLDVLSKETLTRESFSVSPSGSKSYAAGELYGSVEVTPYLLAIEEIPVFRPLDLNLEYGDITFEIGKGDVLAIGETFLFEIIPDTTALPDEMVVRLSTDLDKDTYEISLSGSTIIVLAGSAVKEYWDRVHEDPAEKSHLYQSIYKDCVHVALQKIVEGDEDSLWAKSLLSTLESKGLSIPAAPNENDLNVIALKIMAEKGIQKTLGRLRNV